MEELKDLESIDKIEKVLFKYDHFTVSNSVILGNSDSMNNRNESFTSKTYTSKKYMNRNYLTSINIESKDFLVLKYFDKNIEEGSKSEELYFSVMHMFSLVKTLKTVTKFKETHQCFVYDKNNNVIGLSNEGKNFSILCDNISSGKKMKIEFDVTEYKENGIDIKLIEGVTLLLNSEKFYTTLPMEIFDNLVYFICNLNLLDASQNTLITGLLLNTDKVKNNTVRKTRTIKGEIKNEQNNT